MSNEMVDLPGLVRAEGFNLKQQGRSMGGSSCPVCGPGAEHSNKLCVFQSEDKWRWKCHACGARGDSADFLAAARGISLRAALKELRSGASTPRASKVVAEMSSAPPASLPDSQMRDEALAEVHRRLRQEQFGFFIAQSYFTGRGISQAVFKEAWDRNMVRGMPEKPMAAASWVEQTLGKRLMVKAGLLRPDSKVPAIAFRPIIGLLPGGGGMEFRLARPAKDGELKSIRYGRLTFPWWWPQVDGEELKTITVVEGLVDLLSVKTMGMIPPTMAVMGLPGAQSWRINWFKQLAAKHPGVRVNIALDADEAGERTSKTMAQALQGEGIESSRIRPPGPGDWNDALAYFS